jgi:hypothetical protein
MGSACSNCHRKGHRAEGNKGKKDCVLDKCESYFICGQKSRHPEYSRQLAEKKKELDKLKETLGNVKEQFDMLRNFVQKTSQTNFMMDVKRRRRITDPKRYRDVAVLLRDTRTLKVAYKGKIPPMGQNDSKEFPRLIKQMRNKIKRETGDFNLSDVDDDDDASSDSENLFFGQQRKTVYTTSESTNVSNDQNVQNILSKSKTVDQLQPNSTWQSSVMPPRTMSVHAFSAAYCHATIKPMPLVSSACSPAVTVYVLVKSRSYFCTY